MKSPSVSAYQNQAHIKIMHTLNKELKAKGFYTVAGKLSRRYFEEKFYELCSQIYLDAVVQKRRNLNEHRALCDMVDRYDSLIPSIFIADRSDVF